MSRTIAIGTKNFGKLRKSDFFSSEISKESLFSDVNNLEMVTTTSEEYATSFGFTGEEVFAAMDE
jgi:hypothetical protein